MQGHQILDLIWPSKEKTLKNERFNQKNGIIVLYLEGMVPEWVQLPSGFHFDPNVGTEELGHLEMIAAIVHQLTRNLTDDQIESDPNFAAYFVDHTTGIYPTSASGFPWSAASMQVKGDPICDLTEDMAAEQKARVTYDNILRLAKDDPDVTDVIRFLREREVVHFQRFGSALQMVRDQLDQKNVYYTNPAFDK